MNDMLPNIMALSNMNPLSVNKETSQMLDVANMPMIANQTLRTAVLPPLRPNETQ